MLDGLREVTWLVGPGPLAARNLVGRCLSLAPQSDVGYKNGGWVGIRTLLCCSSMLYLYFKISFSICLTRSPSSSPSAGLSTLVTKKPLYWFAAEMPTPSCDHPFKTVNLPPNITSLSDGLQPLAHSEDPKLMELNPHHSPPPFSLPPPEIAVVPPPPTP